MDDPNEEGWRGERRSRLLEAAGRVFSRHAYEQASMDEIAQEARVGKPTLYRYFPSKDALFAQVFVQALDDLEARLDGVLAQEIGIVARMSGLVAAMVPTFRDHLVALRLLGETAAAADQSKRRIFRERRTRIAGFLALALRQAAADGEIRDIDATRTANFVIGMIWSATASLPAADDDIVRDIVDLVMHGVTRDADSRAAPWCADTGPSVRESLPPARGRAREATS